jgi:hypothetical protein
VQAKIDKTYQKIPKPTAPLSQKKVLLLFNEKEKGKTPSPPRKKFF